MQNKKRNIFQDVYSESLQTISGIKLTCREIDIIAFFVCGRSAKKIASFFSIAPKTVENHTHNIMLKLGCHSREAIIDFIEKSNKLPILRKYYTATLAQAAFNKSLKDIAKMKHGKRVSCTIIYWQEQNSQNLLISHLETSLKRADVNISVKVRNPSQSLQEICKGTYLVYVNPKDWESHAVDEEEVSLFSKTESDILFFHPGTTTPVKILQKPSQDDCINFIDQKRACFLVFEILKKLFPYLNLEKVISEFKSQYETIEGLAESTVYKSSLKEDWIENKKNTFRDKIRFILQNGREHLAPGLVMIGIVVVGLLEFKKNAAQNPSQIPPEVHYKKENANFIRSDFIIPDESVLLNRFDLIEHINNSFKRQGGIQAIALVGVGGAGKTTLARCYAYTQKSPLLWEINAETKETLNGSFETLAQALAKTEEDQKILRGILKTKIAIEREDKVIQFVKERLRSLSNWFLVYDNVEKFTDIQKHFPTDSGAWGQGRVILTTRDSNIETNAYVARTIQIGELNSDQKLDLFMKIMNNRGSFSFTPAQKEEAKKFLVEIPPFPLDVSVAAYYLKATHISYKNYLEIMVEYNKDFSNVQERILKEAGNYTKTRYGIITLSVKHLLDTNPDFKDLLLFISLLDSQNIPRDLLIKCKSALIVDDLIYHLKKYSLINNKLSSDNDSEAVFSIHRSTQSIILAYLIKKLNLAQNKSLLQSTANILENYMGDTVNKEDFAKMKILYRHAESFLNHSDLIDDAVKNSIRGELGCIYYYLRYPMKAKNLLEDSLANLETSFNASHNKMGYFLVYLGNVYRTLGEYEKAKELFEQSLVIYKKQHPGNQAGIARASGYLGVVCGGLGDFKKAKALLERSLIIYQTYPKNQIGLAWSLAHLGNVYKRLGDYKKAKELFEQSLAIYKKYSETHVGAAWVAGDLGDTYIKLGNHKKAKDLLEESLAICNKHFSKDHVFVAQALAHLGVFYRESGNFEKAKNLLRKSLDSFEGTYGKGHLETGFILKDLGQSYFLEGDLNTAETIVLGALNIFHKHKHPEKYMTLALLAEIYLKKSKGAQNDKSTTQSVSFQKQAITYFKQALEGIKNHFSEDSPHITRIQTNLDTCTNLEQSGHIRH